MKTNYDDFIDLCSQMRNPETLHQLFDLFLTIEEKETLASRYVILKALLKEELTQREIAKAFKVSIAQITRGSNALKVLDPRFKKSLKKNLKL